MHFKHSTNCLVLLRRSGQQGLFAIPENRLVAFLIDWWPFGQMLVPEHSQQTELHGQNAALQRLPFQEALCIGSSECAQWD